MNEDYSLRHTDVAECFRKDLEQSLFALAPNLRERIFFRARYRMIWRFVRWDGFVRLRRIIVTIRFFDVLPVQRDVIVKHLEGKTVELLAQPAFFQYLVRLSFTKGDRTL